MIEFILVASFIEAAQCICAHFNLDEELEDRDASILGDEMPKSPPPVSRTLIDVLSDFDGIYLGVNAAANLDQTMMSASVGQLANSNSATPYDNVQFSIEKYEAYNQMKKNLDAFKNQFERVLEEQRANGDISMSEQVETQVGVVP